ncbi:hypothetical protein K505DRAFT_53173 [Melanomma pulvis-pyrius CBS 109.77]|uniref:Uncharacterized protein n=1 Tax=Melanomma pulvis-pyrius CBS 109.77 TaxID=1314802 RepID=A0A6A6X7K0_9PLEO|nr:hypothetical protein K505DRAFT_53173 [Melanomma pulvis-pyrius CBS 109.77]
MVFPLCIYVVMCILGLYVDGMSIECRLLLSMVMLARCRLLNSWNRSSDSYVSPLSPSLSLSLCVCVSVCVCFIYFSLSFCLSVCFYIPNLINQYILQEDYI